MEVDIQKIIQAAHAGGAILKTYFGQSLDVVQKTVVSDIKTKADEESEQAIIAYLKEHFPEANIHSEEMGKINNDSEYTFVIDPLDGTHNFFLGLPTFTVSIGLVHNSSIIAGVIYAPIIDQTYYAEKGKGAFLEGKQLRASVVTDVTQAVIAVHFGYTSEPEVPPKFFERLYKKDTTRIINDWCSTYYFCLIASGKIDGLTFERCELHDCCAGKLIAKEAGCIITDYQGKPETDELSLEFLMAGTSEMIKELVDVAK